MTERQLVEWKEWPYTAHEHRSTTVHHRVMLYVYDHGVDLEHQARSDGTANVPSDWTPVDIWEVRDGEAATVRLLQAPRIQKE